jgi:hypothetical protein
VPTWEATDPAQPMAQLQPVPRAPSPFAGREGALVAAVGLALLIAIVKPWGPGAGEPMPSPYASPKVTASAAASDGRGFELRTEMFGPFEPTPEWSIWPAGYFVSVMYVARAPRNVVVASPEPSDKGQNASPSQSAVPAQSPSSPPGADWPATIDVGVDDHLLWIGINTPRGWTLDRALLRRIGADGASTAVEIRRIPSPWPDHFTALGLASPGSEHALAVWPAGIYNLELVVSPGDIRRTLEIRIQTAPDPAPELPSRQR